MARRPITTEIEVYPEADRLSDFPHPRHTTALQGHDAPCAEFADAVASGRLHHAWMLTGLEGIGKATFAYRAAKYLLASPDERQADLTVGANTVAARQVNQLSHPGLLVIRRAYDIKAKRFPTAITVDEVRRLRGFLSHKSDPGQWRVVIVDRADELNTNAANALLKSLEEPPERTVFFLIAIEPGRLLPTIRSRCRLLPFHRLNDQDLIAAGREAYSARANAADSEETDFSAVAAFSDGSVRRLLAMTEGQGQTIAASIEQIFTTLPKVDWPRCHELADKLAPAQAQSDFELFFTLLQEKLARLVRAHGLPGLGSEHERALQLVGHDGLASWAELWETLHREKAQNQALNLDRAAFLMDVFSRIAQTASR